MFLALVLDSGDGSVSDSHSFYSLEAAENWFSEDSDAEFLRAAEYEFIIIDLSTYEISRYKLEKSVKFVPFTE